jgi:hypothetical protein
VVGLWWVLLFGVGGVWVVGCGAGWGACGCVLWLVRCGLLVGFLRLVGCVVVVRGWCVWGVANPLWSNKGSPPTDLSPGRWGEADELNVLFQSFRIFPYLETGTSPGPRFRLFSFVKA